MSAICRPGLQSISSAQGCIFPTCSGHIRTCFSHSQKNRGGEVSELRVDRAAVAPRWVIIRLFTSAFVASVAIVAGAKPRTDFLTAHVAGEPKGFLPTGAAVAQLPDWPERRPPLPLETSLPGVLAAGVCRSGTAKLTPPSRPERPVADRLQQKMRRPSCPAATARPCNMSHLVAALLAGTSTAYVLQSSKRPPATTSRMNPGLLDGLIVAEQILRATRGAN